MSARRVSPPPPDPAETTARAHRALKEQGFVKLSALGTPKVRAPLVAELIRLGFEVTRTVVRRPVIDQLRSILDEGTFVSLKAAPSLVAGATGADVKKAMARMVREGQARVVLRTKAETLVPGDADVLTPRELRALREGLEALRSQVLSVSRASGAGTLLRSDCLAALTALTPASSTLAPATTPANAQALAAGGLAPPVPSGASPPATAPSPAGGPAAPLGSGQPALAAQGGPGWVSGAAPSPAWTQDNAARLLAALEAARDPRLGLAFVPRIVRDLAPRWDVGAVHALLLEASRQGAIELRPESGLARLSEQELRDCPPGPQGTRLSWARRL